MYYEFVFFQQEENTNTKPMTWQEAKAIQDSFKGKSGAEKIKFFVGKYGAELIAAIKGTGLYFPAVVAQMCWESNYGLSDAALMYNNFSGIRNLSGNVPFAVGASNDSNKYAIYQNATDYFKSHVAVVRKQRYIQKGVLTATTPEAQLKAIANGGYCADPADPNVYFNQINPLLQKVKKMYTTGKVA